MCHLFLDVMDLCVHECVHLSMLYAACCCFFWLCCICYVHRLIDALCLHCHMSSLLPASDPRKLAVGNAPLLSSVSFFYFVANLTNSSQLLLGQIVNS